MPKRILLPTVVAAALLGTTAYTSAHMTPAMVMGAPVATVAANTHTGDYVAGGDAVTQVPLIKPVPNTKVHHVRLDLTHKVVDLGDGTKFEGWTFGDSIPGPTVHVRQGDKVIFEMANRSTEKTAEIMPPMPHSIDFHSAMVSPHDKYRTIYPGETIKFEWTANYPGVFMYHCGTPMLLHHMIMGMYGAVVVDPPGGWPGKVDREYVVVQSEVYSKPKDPKKPELLEADMKTAMDKQPSHVVFNGQVNRHVKQPLKAKPGERVRLYVLNIGPNDTSSFHIVGTIMDKVYMDGNPANVLRGMQTVLLGSSNGAVVEFVIPEAGEYPFLDHEFTDATKGAMGYIDATDRKVAKVATPDTPLVCAPETQKTQQ